METAMDWEEVKLGDISSLIKRGVTPKYVENAGFLIFNQKCIRDNKLTIEPARLTSSNRKINESKLITNDDILINSTGKGTLGRSCIVKNLHEKATVDTHVTIVRLKEEKSAPNFIAYQLNLKENEIESLGKGATNQTELSAKDLERIIIKLPPLPTQQKIASILGAYDDLIENNLKRIQLLEEAAQNLYKEWFVNFKFPNHETHPIDKETGLPEGWEKKKFDEVSEISGGGTPSTKISSYWENGDIIWFSPTDLTKSESFVLTNSKKKITEIGLKKSSAKLLKPKTILLSSRATIGLLGMINKKSTTNQGFINIDPLNNLYRYYILFNLKIRKPELESFASGATFKEISKKSFKSLDILIPNEKLLESYNSYCERTFNSIENLLHNLKALKEARDLLLPRLMNQDLDV
jgi:type I restriction enzyme S subunit